MTIQNSQAPQQSQDKSQVISRIENQQQQPQKIQFEYEKKKSNDGSLLNLFKSQYFTTHMMLQYLCKKSEIGVIDYLVNSMYRLNQSQIDFYLPQLWQVRDDICVCVYAYMYLNFFQSFGFEQKCCPKFEALFVITHCKITQYWLKSKNKIKIFQLFKELFIQILYHSATYLQARSDQVKRQADKFSIDVEMAIVNKNASFRGGGLKQYQDMSEQQILQLFQMKQFRQDYLTIQQSFIEALINYSCQLKKFDLSIRLPSLKVGIIELNKYIEANVRSKAGALDSRGLKCFRGILFPFKIGQDDDHDPLLILNILTDQLACFNTKKRAPIKLIFQTIRLSEAQKWNEKMSPVPRSDSSYDQVNLLTTLATSRLHKQGSEDQKHSQVSDMNDQEVSMNQQQEKDFEKLRKFAKTIQGAELRMSCQGVSGTSAFPKSAIMDVDNDQIFKENPFGDSDAVRTSDIFFDRSMTPVSPNLSQKDIEAIMMPNLDQNISKTQKQDEQKTLE